MFMGKKRKAVMLGVNVFLVLALLWSVVFTVDRKNAAYTNTDIERYKSLNTIPKLGAVTNSRTAEIQFSLYDEKLYGIALFFLCIGRKYRWRACMFIEARWRDYFRTDGCSEGAVCSCQ